MLTTGAMQHFKGSFQARYLIKPWLAGGIEGIVPACIAKDGGDLQKSIFILLIVLIRSTKPWTFFVQLENYKTVQD